MYAQHSSSITGPARFRLSKLAAAILCAQCAAPTAQALPTGGQVTAGEARIALTNDPTTMQITQFTDHAVIDWKTFDIGGKESVNVLQAKPDYVLLNRVNGGSVSTILGKLSADGRVFLINPSGVVFGPNAQVNVGGLVASTANIANKDFMAGQYNFAQAGAAGARIVNQGRITAASGGLVALVAPGVENAGVIQANFGKVTLASGNVFTLDMFGDRLVSRAVDDRVAEKLVDSNGQPVKALINQIGELRADGGEVVLISAGAAKGIVDNVINMSGIITARSLSELPGVIVLRGAGGAVEVSGELNAAAPAAANADGVAIAGGTVKILGDEVHLANTALVDVNGSAGGGQVLIGADRIRDTRSDRALNTTLDKGARVLANGGDQGNGGSVRVWADDTIDFKGSIAARGGDQRGDGDFVELAAGKTLRFDGSVDVSAPNGKPGTLVKSPEPVTVPVTSPGTTPPTPPGHAPTAAPGTPVGTTGTTGTTGTADPSRASQPAGQTVTPAVVLRANDAVLARLNSTVGQSVDNVLVQARSVAPTLEVMHVELAAGFELDDGALFIPDYQLVPRRDGLHELHIPNPFALGRYSDMQLGGNMMMMGGMGSFGNGGTQLFSFSSNAMTGGAGGVSGGGAGGAGMGGGGMASAPGRLPQNAQTTAESIAGDILSDGPVALTSAADSAPSSAPLALAGLDSKLVASGSRKPRGAADGAGDAHKLKAAAHGGSPPSSGDGKGAMVQAEQQQSEYMPQLL